MRAEIEPADRLKALSEADHRGACELADARDDAHRRDRCIAIGPRRRIEAGHGNRCKTLPAQARNSAAREVGVACRRGRKQAQPDTDAARNVYAGQQQAEADKLTQNGGERRAPDAHAKGEDEKRVERHVQHAAGDQPDHRIYRIALQAKLIVEHERRGHIRCADQNNAHIVERIGQNGVRCAEEMCERMPQQQPQNHDNAAGAECGEKTGRRHAFSLLAVLRAELTGNVVARALSEEKADRLDKRHERKHDTDCAGRARTEPPDKKSVGHVVNGCDQHADDGRHGHFTDQRLDWRLSHLNIFSSLCICLQQRYASFSLSKGDLPSRSWENSM